VPIASLGYLSKEDSVETFRGVQRAGGASMVCEKNNKLSATKLTQMSRYTHSVRGTVTYSDCGKNRLNEGYTLERFLNWALSPCKLLLESRQRGKALVVRLPLVLLHIHLLLDQTRWRSIY